MLPELVSLAKNPQSRLQALMAMGSTGSKDAIPILLELLKDPDAGVRDCAGSSLRLLTHRTSTQDSKGSDTRGEYMQWKKWWASEGATAPIYKDIRQKSYGNVGDLLEGSSYRHSHAIKI
jgi:HEAT repeats